MNEEIGGYCRKVARSGHKHGAWIGECQLCRIEERYSFWYTLARLLGIGQ